MCTRMIFGLKFHEVECQNPISILSSEFDSDLGWRQWKEIVTDVTETFSMRASFGNLLGWSRMIWGRSGVIWAGKISVCNWLNSSSQNQTRVFSSFGWTRFQKSIRRFQRWSISCYWLHWKFNFENNKKNAFLLCTCFFFIDPRANDYISYKAGLGFPLSGS